MKIKKWSFKKIYFVLIFFSSLQSCENSGIIKDSYVEPHIVFSSYRWWNYDIMISDIYGKHFTHLTKNRWIDFNPTVSPDGYKLAFVSERDNNREIYIMDLIWMDGYTQWEGRNLINLSKTSGHEWSPRFSPNNDKLIYSYYEANEDNYDVYIIDTDGKNKRNLTSRPGYEILPQFSPDGSFIIFQSWQFGVKEIFFINLLEEIEINLTRSPKSNDILTDGNVFSPDGRKIVFCSDRDGNKNIYIMNTDGSNQKQLTINSADDWNPKYFSDNKIIFQSLRDNNWEIYIMKLDGSEQINLTNHPGSDYSFVALPLNSH